MINDTTRHLDLLELDLVRRGEGTDEHGAHVEACARCQDALADLRLLAAGLQEQLGSPLAVPDTVDRKVLWLAQKQAALVRGRRKGGPRRVWESPATRWAIAAAVVLALASLVTRSAVPPAERPLLSRAAPVATDVNGDGRIDILDAFTLARAVETGRADRETWDADANGRVDHADVDIVARAAVALGERT